MYAATGAMLNNQVQEKNHEVWVLLTPPPFIVLFTSLFKVAEINARAVSHCVHFGAIF